MIKKVSWRRVWRPGEAPADLLAEARDAAGRAEAAAKRAREWVDRADRLFRALEADRAEGRKAARRARRTNLVARKAADKALAAVVSAVPAAGRAGGGAGDDIVSLQRRIPLPRATVQNRAITFPALIVLAARPELP